MLKHCEQVTTDQTSLLLTYNSLNVQNDLRRIKQQKTATFLNLLVKNI